MDTGLLELDQWALGVGAGPLCRRAVCPRCLGSRALELAARRLGVDTGALALDEWRQRLRTGRGRAAVDVRGIAKRCAADHCQIHDIDHVPVSLFCGQT